jgi:hypothetical protein
MSNASTEIQEDLTEDFTPQSFIIFCLDSDGSVAFEVSWGDTIEEIKKFTLLLHKATTGEFNELISEQLKIQSKNIENGLKKFNAFSKTFNELSSPLSLVIDPTNVELS